MPSKMNPSDKRLNGIKARYWQASNLAGFTDINDYIDYLTDKLTATTELLKDSLEENKALKVKACAFCGRVPLVTEVKA